MKIQQSQELRDEHKKAGVPSDETRMFGDEIAAMKAFSAKSSSEAMK